MPLPDSFLQELISRNPIEDVVDSYVRTRRRGRTAVGLCPFHGEKTPSFTVYPETASFYCFGCGAGGDVITFIKKIENLDYLDAVRFLADRAGMKMPEDKADDAVSRLRMRVLEANRDAARYFHAALYSPAGRPGLEYYYRRGYTDNTIRRFGLGYAPEGFHNLLDHMRKKGYRDDELIDIRGNVIAFGGRVLDDSKPKYLNTADTLVFKKTNNLFALNFAKASKEGSLILCEGYMDVIALHQAGFTNAVAALGTSFTEVIARYVNEVILVFDADAAGQKGAKRAIGLLRETGVHIRVITIPDGKDPDEFIKHNGPERFKLLIDRSANDVEYQLIDLGRRHALDTADGRVAYLREASQLLARLSSPVERDVYAGKLASEMGVGKSAILSQVEHFMAAARRQKEKKQLSQAVRRAEESTRKVNPEAEKHLRGSRAEEGLLGLLILNPDYIRAVSQRLPPEEMVTAFNRALYARLLERHRQGLLIELAFLSADYNADEMAYISHMVQTAREGTQTPEQAMEYAEIIRAEHTLSELNSPGSLSDDTIQSLLAAMREQKK